MGYEELTKFAESYPKQERDSLTRLAGDYRSRQESEILDLAAIAADVTVDSIINLGLESDPDPLFMRAFGLQYPGVEIESLRGASDERLQGLANGVKGKYFEVLVEQRLNAGERLGELYLEPGLVARIAESPTQEGFDLEIVNQDEVVVDLLQLKATESMAHVKSALRRFPNIKVAVPSEVEGVADDILRTDISHAHLAEVVRKQIGELSESELADILNQGVEAVFDSVPLISPIIIAVTEGREVLMRRSTLEEALQQGSRRLGRSSVYSGIGATLSALDAGVITLPTTLALRLAEGRVTRRVAMGDHLKSKTNEIRTITGD